MVQAVQQRTNIVEAEAWLEVPKITCLYNKLLFGSNLSIKVQRNPQHVVHRLLEAFVRTSHFGLQFCHDVVIECQCGSHELRLLLKPHDVKQEAS